MKFSHTLLRSYKDLVQDFVRYYFNKNTGTRNTVKSYKDLVQDLIRS